MAISHLCTRCGHDLARISARVEPLYGLPLVTCGHCGHHVVRRRHPLIVRYRQLRRLDATLLALLVQGALGAGFIAITLFVCVAWPMAFSEFGMGLFGRQTLLLTAVLSFVVLPTALGLWFTVGLGHWPNGSPWAVFAALITVALSLDTVVGPMITRVAYSIDSRATLVPWAVEMLAARVVVLCGIIVVSAAGIAPGMFVRRSFQRFRVARWRVRRRRWRTRRNTA